MKMTTIDNGKTKRLGKFKMILLGVLCVIVVTTIIAIALPMGSNSGQENPNTANNQPKIESNVGN